jgi:uncharacterized protein YqeY
MRLRPRKDSNLKETSTFKSRINRDTVNESYKIDDGVEHCKNYSGSLISSLPWRDNTNGADDSFGYDIEPDYGTFLRNLRQNSNSGPDGENIDKGKNSRNITDGEKIDKVKNSTNITGKVKVKTAKPTTDVNISWKLSHKSKGFLNPHEQSFLDFGEKESNDTVFKIKDRKTSRHEKEAEKRVCVTDLSVNVEQINTVKISKNITEKVKVKAAKDLEDDSIAARVLKRRKQSLLDFSVNKRSGLAERCLSDTKILSKAEKISEVKTLTTLIDNVNLKPAKDLKDIDMFGKVSHNSKGDSNITNQCDHSFLNFGKKQSNGAVFVTENGKKLKYEIKAEECFSDTEIYVMGDAPVCSEENFTPFECNKQYLLITDTGAENTVDRGRSYFREEVMNIYKKPYDQDEYEQLLEAVKSKKPIKGRKNHRKSLLEHNADLKAELDRFFFDRPKMLNILRGFFYWLQNISHEGIFKPWLDPTCLAIKPVFKAHSSAIAIVEATLNLEL